MKVYAEHAVQDQKPFNAHRLRPHRGLRQRRGAWQCRGFLPACGVTMLGDKGAESSCSSRADQKPLVDPLSADTAAQRRPCENDLADKVCTTGREPGRPLTVCCSQALLATPRVSLSMGLFPYSPLAAPQAVCAAPGSLPNPAGSLVLWRSRSAGAAQQRPARPRWTASTRHQLLPAPQGPTLSTAARRGAATKV